MREQERDFVNLLRKAYAQYCNANDKRKTQEYKSDAKAAAIATVKHLLELVKLSK